MPETYEMSVDGELTCFKCDTQTHAGMDTELRHCSHCGYWHISHLKPSWAKDDLEMDVVETAMGMETERDKTMGHRTDALRLVEEKFWKATSALAAERAG